MGAARRSLPFAFPLRVPRTCASLRSFRGGDTLGGGGRGGYVQEGATGGVWLLWWCGWRGRKGVSCVQSRASGARRLGFLCPRLPRTTSELAGGSAVRAHDLGAGRSMTRGHGEAKGETERSVGLGGGEGACGGRAGPRSQHTTNRGTFIRERALPPCWGLEAKSDPGGGKAKHRPRVTCAFAKGVRRRGDLRWTGWQRPGVGGGSKCKKGSERRQEHTWLMTHRSL